ALEMEREDLALGLLRRDGKVAGRDREALPLAARRGWHEVVATLLAAGADANARDDSGRSAADFAARRRDNAILRTLAAAGAQAAAGPRPRPPEAADFVQVAAFEIDDVAFFDPPRYAFG